MLLKLHFSPVWRVFSFIDKYSSEDPSNLSLVTFLIDRGDVWDISTHTNSNLLLPFYALKAIKKKQAGKYLFI